MQTTKIFKHLLLSITILALGFGLTNQFLFDEWEQSLTQQETALTKLQQENQAAEKYRAERDALQEKVAEAEKNYKQIENYLPVEDKFDQLFDDVKVHARQANLTLLQNDNFHPPYKAGLNQSPLTIQLRGKFPDQLKFLSWLSEYSRVIVFPQQEVSNNGGDTVMLLKGFAPVDVADKTSKKNGEFVASVTEPKP